MPMAGALRAGGPAGDFGARACHLGRSIGRSAGHGRTGGGRNLPEIGVEERRVTDRPTVTAAIIAQNEADRLAALVAQLEWADQIVVIDGGSRDGTAEVAAAHGCDVVTRPLDSFANQRNAALELARCDWVLSIDADERPAGGLVEEIRSRLGQNGYVGYRVAIRSEIFGRRFRWSGTQLDRPVRLVRRGYGRWVGAVHEVLAVDGRVGRLRGWLEHRTLPDLDAFLAKVHRYSELAAQAAVAAGRPPGPFDRW
ncbi:MAG TPA: glycosyltransferase family 2 protein, partial [Planctomycetaceae bacterium]|nr:glycosyltransferase family 2 protein [Planctomycetaceae bacterium]